MGNSRVVRNESRSRENAGFTLVELLVVIAIIGILVSLLLPAVQAAREAARRSQCTNNMKQIGLGVHNFESSYSVLPSPGQCDSTGSSSTTYMIHSPATMILPYIEQQAVFDMFDVRADALTVYKATQKSGIWTTPSGAQLHRKAKGLAYNDPAHPSGQIAAKTVIETFICPTTPLAATARDPVHGYGPFDYMFIALSDVDERPSSPTFKQRTTPAGSPAWQSQVVAGMLTCDDGGFGNVTDGTSNTFLCIEDVSRSHPSVASFGAYSSRVSPVSSPADPIEGSTNPPSTFPNGRRVFAWADPDATTNGFSGANGASNVSDRVARVNNNKMPVGGPSTCPWIKNNCGPNDEPFSFHPGGVNVVLGDGSVRFISDSTDALVLKALVGANDGAVVELP